MPVNIETYANLMAETFKDDPCIRAQYEGIAGGLRIYQSFCRYQLEEFIKAGCVSTYGDGDGMTMGYFTSGPVMEQLEKSAFGAAEHMMRTASMDALIKISNNSQVIVETTQPDWYRKYTGTKEVFILQLILVRGTMRGTDVFDKLITPILEKAKQRNAPVVHHTYDVALVERFERFGFRMMEKITSNKIDLSCYHLLKE
jgi:hypothetical protein